MNNDNQLRSFRETQRKADELRSARSKSKKAEKSHNKEAPKKDEGVFVPASMRKSKNFGSPRFA